MKKFMLIVLYLCLLGQASAQVTQPVVNEYAPLYTLTIEDARLVYTGRKQVWEDGSRIVVFMLPRVYAATRYFAAEHLGMSASSLFDQVTYRNSTSKTDEILILSSEVEMLSKVSRIPGSVGYVSKYIIYNDGASIKRLKITP